MAKKETSRVKHKPVRNGGSGRPNQIKAICIAEYPRSTQPSILLRYIGKSSTGLLAGVKAGRVHLCRVAGPNTV